MVNLQIKFEIYILTLQQLLRIVTTITKNCIILKCNVFENLNRTPRSPLISLVPFGFVLAQYVPEFWSNSPIISI